MSDLSWLMDDQMERLRPFFPKSHGRPRVDDCRELSGNVFITKNSLRWRDAPSALRPDQDALQPVEALERRGRVHADDGGAGGGRRRAENDDNRRHLPEGASHGWQPAAQKGGFGRLIGCTKGGLNAKINALANTNGRPLSFFLTVGQISDYTGAAVLLDDMPKAQWLLGDRGYDAD